MPLELQNKNKSFRGCQCAKEILSFSWHRFRNSDTIEVKYWTTYQGKDKLSGNRQIIWPHGQALNWFWPSYLAKSLTGVWAATLWFHRPRFLLARFGAFANGHDPMLMDFRNLQLVISAASCGSHAWYSLQWHSPHFRNLQLVISAARCGSHAWYSLQWHSPHFRNLQLVISAARCGSHAWYSLQWHSPLLNTAKPLIFTVH